MEKKELFLFLKNDLKIIEDSIETSEGESLYHFLTGKKQYIENLLMRLDLLPNRNYP